ncbi:hypothetical protein [Paractinoplanes atraurantiacus]|uniref:Uncharacterized protein n=1 Tax=Paractinoplanes atraurantiacus TaxID=1036182 RepID=A0A285JC39_9ACTN|nr:hypothetical protein [Actinoplanes atraurantiacus]SNY57653.1 hypothetical protein SAMN05421748_118151 [Actinoplanes atraurantiacus]
MAQNAEGLGRVKQWFHDTFDDWWFRSLIGPAQTRNAVQGCDEGAREQWKRDLENRKRYTREQRERKRLEREAAQRS